MLTPTEALEAQVDVAMLKAQHLRHRSWAFGIAGVLGGAYIGIGGVLMLTATGPLVAQGDPLARVIGGLVFGVGLILVVFAGAELVTSTMMTVTQALAAGTMTLRSASLLVTVTLMANFLGTLLFAALVAASGVLRSNPAAAAMLADALQGRADQSPLELFARAILCNVLVCLAVWMSVRVTAAGAKIAVILLGILAFVASGYEHVVANMTFYWLGVFAGDLNAAAPLFAGNMLWVGLGNLVGGSLVVGLGTWLLAGSPRFEQQANRVGANAGDRSQRAG